MNNLIVTKKNHIICQKCGTADRTSNLFIVKDKTDDRLSKDNLTFYEVKCVYGGGQSFTYPKMTLNVGDVVITEAVGIDITYEGVEYKVFDVDYIVSTVKL